MTAPKYPPTLMLLAKIVGVVVAIIAAIGSCVAGVFS